MKIGRKNKKISDFQSPYTVGAALKKGDIFTRLGFLIMGSSNIVRGQIIKGLIFLAIEISFICYMALEGVFDIINLFHLGGEAQKEVWNDAKGIYEYTQGDNSLLFLLYGIATLFLLAFFIIMWRTAVKSGYKAQYLKENGKKLPSFKDDFKSLRNQNLYGSLLTLPVLGIVCFTILPLVFMIAMAFTNYSKEGDHLVLFNWVGLKAFKEVLNLQGNLGQTFGSVLVWTIVWAIFATFLNYILGMILAIVINRDGTKIKGFWRFCFILSAAIPQFVSLLLMRTVLQPQGLLNVMLQNAGLITHPLPFLTNATWARVTVIVVNLWVGIPFTMMQVTGILKNIPGDIYEAAKVDGAGVIVTFFKITLPYMLFVTTPYLIATFMGNINNFNIIYLLTGGAPTEVGSSAGKTDLLVTWLYKLTIDQQKYNIGAVIGIMTFVVLAVVSLITYRQSGSYKNEEGFQ